MRISGRSLLRILKTSLKGLGSNQGFGSGSGVFAWGWIRIWNPGSNEINIVLKEASQRKRYSKVASFFSSRDINTYTEYSVFCLDCPFKSIDEWIIPLNQKCTDALYLCILEEVLDQERPILKYDHQMICIIYPQEHDDICWIHISMDKRARFTRRSINIQP